MRCVYLDQVTFERAKPVVECQPAYHAIATLFGVAGEQSTGKTRTERPAHLRREHMIHVKANTLLTIGGLL